MSYKYGYELSVNDWMMCALLEEYESLPALSNPPKADDERIEWMKQWMKEEDGKWVWKDDSNNEWGWIWREKAEQWLDCMGDIPKNLKRAILSDIVNDYSCREDSDGDPHLLIEIKDLAEDDEITEELMTALMKK